MAASSNVDEKQVKDEIPKGRVKRKYLLTDEDLEDLRYENRVNPLNKSYPPMKIFKLSDVEAKAVEKWGSLENLENKHEKKKQQKVKLETQKEDDKRQFWDCDEIYEPLKHFMEKIEIPGEKRECCNEGTGGRPEADGLLSCDVILCYSDCMNSRPPGPLGRGVFKRFPSIAEVDKSTRYNDRKKMAHFSWSLDENEENIQQLVVNLYVVHKWDISSKLRASLPVLTFDALSLALKRLSALLTDTLTKESRTHQNLRIGTYTPYRVDQDRFKQSLTENMQFPVQVFTTLESATSS